jgi:hypothetical protein
MKNKKPRRKIRRGGQAVRSERYSTLPTPDGESAAPGLVK